jgi:hypothetical protein
MIEYDPKSLELNETELLILVIMKEWSDEIPDQLYPHIFDEPDTRDSFRKKCNIQNILRMLWIDEKTFSKCAHWLKESGLIKIDYYVWKSGICHVSLTYQGRHFLRKLERKMQEKELISESMNEGSVKRAWKASKHVISNLMEEIFPGAVSKHA